MKRGIAALFLLLLNGIAITAKEVEPDMAFRVASNFVSGYSSLRSSSALQWVYTAVEAPGSGLRSAAAGRPLFYVYNVEDEGGFVMVSGDDTAQPILAYADKGAFQAHDMPGNLKNRLSFYEKEISSLLEKGHAPSAETSEKWDALLKGTTKAATPVVLLPTANWDQTEPFNNLCPMDSGMRALAGCVATSMGIVMKYRQWPEKGTGSNTYKTSSKQISLTADFNVTYRWEDMPDTYTRNSSLAQREAVATLIYHCGVASYMDYAYDGSGATEWDAANALINHFGYDKGLCMVYKALYTADEWHALIRNELDEDRPLLYGGVTKDQEGHLFIIDGYDTQNYYHVNWGWSGVANGYYLLSSLDPQWQGAGGSKEGEGYAFEQDAIIGLQKATRQSLPNHEFFFLDEGEFDVYGLSTDVDMITRDKPFKLRISYVFDYGRRDFDGMMGFFVVDENGNRKITLEEFDYSLKADYVLYDNEGETYTITSDTEKGDKIRMYYKPRGKEWKPVRGTPNTVTELPVEVPLLTSNEPVVKTTPAITVSTAIDGTAIDVLSTDDNPLRTVRLFDLSGRLLEELNVYNSNETHILFHINNMPPGVYIVSVQTARSRSEHKIIKH
ncbi:MAG: thiol protease/hemagglutinin PrtT [Tannerellaceae bacterium]|jgi:hypothetical protein|nr:thiol protease/hemagglutinin PrtT [Tannerellaceae bacterium]